MPKFVVGDRVRFEAHDDIYEGAVVKIDNKGLGDILHVQRYDGQLGSGYEGAWRVSASNSRLSLAPKDSLKPVLPTDADARNALPIMDAAVWYFPNAIAEVAKVSVAGNKQHNLGPLHWDRSKSTDHANKILKHLIDSGTFDTDGTRHSAKVAWRALALLEDELIAAGATPGRNARNSPNAG